MTGMIRIADPDSIGAVIVDLREMTQLSQRGLVEEVGGAFRQGQLSLWEVNKGLPSMPNFVRLVQALGYDLALVPREDA